MITLGRVLDKDMDTNTEKRRTIWPPLPVKPASKEPWRPVMTEQERQEHEKYVQDHNLPF